MKYILLMKNGVPFAMHYTVQSTEKAIRETGGWNLWDIYDMSYIPAVKIVPIDKRG